MPRLGGFEAVSVTTQPTFAFGNAVAVIVAGQTDLSIAPPIQVVLNWTEELKQHVPIR